MARRDPLFRDALRRVIAEEVAVGRMRELPPTPIPRIPGVAEPGNLATLREVVSMLLAVEDTLTPEDADVVRECIANLQTVIERLEREELEREEEIPETPPIPEEIPPAPVGRV